MHYNYSYNCMYALIKMYVCAIKVTHIIVCIHNDKYSYKSMFT